MSREDTAPGTPGLHLDEDPPPNELPPTRPFASDAPLPPHDSLPAEMVGERKTDRAPATLDGVRDLLVQLIEEHHAGLEGVYLSIGGLATKVEALSGKVDNLTAHHETHVVRNERLTKAQENLSDALVKFTAEMGEFRKHVEQQASHEGEQHQALRQSVTDIEQRTNHGGE